MVDPPRSTKVLFSLETIDSASNNRTPLTLPKNGSAYILLRTTKGKKHASISVNSTRLNPPDKTIGFEFRRIPTYMAQSKKLKRKSIPNLPPSNTHHQLLFLPCLTFGGQLSRLNRVIGTDLSRENPLCFETRRSSVREIQQKVMVCAIGRHVRFC